MTEAQRDKVANLLRATPFDDIRITDSDGESVDVVDIIGAYYTHVDGSANSEIIIKLDILK